MLCNFILSDGSDWFLLMAFRVNSIFLPVVLIIIGCHKGKLIMSDRSHCLLLDLFDVFSVPVSYVVDGFIISHLSHWLLLCAFCVILMFKTSPICC